MGAVLCPLAVPAFFTYDGEILVLLKTWQRLGICGRQKW